MIDGVATIEGTFAGARGHAKIAYGVLGGTGWHVSPAGFGCYRVSIGVKPHYESITRALSQGVNLIDTSTNYADGGSEELVGQVLNDMIAAGRLKREQVAVVSKAGYLQGRNYALSEERKAQGRPFDDLVPWGKGLAHCIHPGFLTDQLDRSLSRLQLKTLDLFLLHNPEYYLDWAARQGVDLDQARETFYRRIGKAFEHLEEEVKNGRIQYYGISANTFPFPSDHPEFVSLDRVWEIAQSTASNHHFRVIQFPMNLLEPAAVLEANQPEGLSLLQFAQSKQLGVLVNRPLNAFDGNRLIRLAEIASSRRSSDEEIIQAINALNKSEKKLWRKVLPAMGLPGPLYQRIKDQAAIGDHFKHYWRNFGTYDRWCQFRDSFVWPRMQGVFDYLEQQAAQREEVERWLDTHRRNLEAAIARVESLYSGSAAREMVQIRHHVAEADAHWGSSGNLSQMALRALRSTAGVTTVLVGMRQLRYVEDILEELYRPVTVADRSASWRNLQRALTKPESRVI